MECPCHNNPVHCLRSVGEKKLLSKSSTARNKEVVICAGNNFGNSAKYVQLTNIFSSPLTKSGEMEK